MISMTMIDTPMIDAAAGPAGALFLFAFFYPITMSFFWIIGGLYYYFRRERGTRVRSDPPPMKQYPLATLLVPCHNEGANVDETIAALDAQKYPDFEIIAINDGSTDDTGPRLDALAARYPRLRVLHLDRNQGKANALRMGTVAARSEYLVCVDGDALLDEYATHWMIWHLTSGPRVGAVTGNPRVRNRSSLLGRLQVGEFSSIIGMIKRAQRVYGRLFTVSGVICAFRRTALHNVGYWSDDMVTEDIDISWRLQIAHWDIRYEPNALCFILMPETLRGLWNQRLRWARGGVEVALRHGSALFNWRRRRMWGVLLEYALSVAWAYVMAFIIVLWALGKFVAMPAELTVDTLLPRWHGMVLTLVCMLQFALSLLIDRRYEPRIGRNYYWMVWYPAAYWLLSLFTTVVALPRTLLGSRNQRATWKTTDRGIR